MKLITDVEVKANMGGGIYCIECLKNGKRYIGSSVNLFRRYWNHKSYLTNNKHTIKELQKDYREFGGDEFVFTILQFIGSGELKELLDRETFFIKLLNSYINGYNGIGDTTHEKRGGVAAKEVYCKNLISKELDIFDSISRCGEYIFKYAEETNQPTTLKVCKGRVSEIANQSRGYKNIYSFKDHTFSLSLEGIKEMESKIDTGQKQRPVQIVELNMVFDSVKKAAEHISSIIGRRADPSNIRKGLNAGKNTFYGYTILEA
jgi:hypothetical protein